MAEVTTSDLAQLCIAALRNSRRLLDDADLLAKHGRYPSAFSCATLAADELGKHVLINNFFEYEEPSEENRQRLMSAFRNHTEKLGELVLLALVSDIVAGDAPVNYGALHKRRLDATYVDLSTTTNAVTAPVTEISRIEYEEIATSIERLVAASEAALLSMDVAALSTAFAVKQASAVERRGRRRYALLASLLYAGIIVLSRGSATAASLSSLDSLDPLDERGPAA